MKILILSLTLCFIAFAHLKGQEYFRMSADYTVKVKRADGSMNLTRGSVYYDKNIRELIYRVDYPRKETWVIADTSLFKFRNDSLIERMTIPSIAEFTVFHLSLNSGISDFGLKQSRFKVNKVERRNGSTLSYWKIPKELESTISHVVVAKKGGHLESVFMVGEDNRVMSKQFYRDYQMSGAFEFPMKIIQLIPDESGKNHYQVTEFRNIRINDMDNDALYTYPALPAL